MDSSATDYGVAIHPGVFSSAVVAATLFDTPSVVNLSDSDDFEVQPGVFASVYVNLKALASHPASRKVVSSALAAFAE